MKKKRKIKRINPNIGPKNQKRLYVIDILKQTSQYFNSISDASVAIKYHTNTISYHLRTSDILDRRYLIVKKTEFESKGMINCLIANVEYEILFDVRGTVYQLMDYSNFKSLYPNIEISESKVRRLISENKPMKANGLIFDFYYNFLV